jgi:hypothetical protein
MMQWMRIDKDTATATYDGSVKSFNDDGSVSDAGLRIAIDEAKKAANINREVAFSESPISLCCAKRRERWA